MEADLRFEREKRSGVAAVGSYLIDAARRVGVGLEAECGRLGLCDSCAVRITSGGECLSELTRAEIEQLGEERRRQGERLACQAKVREIGEIVVMTTEKKKPEAPSPEEEKERYRKQFAELPLEKKIAQLVELEALTLGETFSFIVNSPFKIIDKLTDLMAEFGLKLDQQARESVRPEEHREEPAAAGAAEPKSAKKSASTRRAKKTDGKRAAKKDES